MLPLQTTIGWVGPQNHYWEWIREHLPQIENIPAEQAMDWWNLQRGVLAIALDARQDSRIALVEQLQKSSGAGSAPSSGSSSTPAKPKAKRSLEKETRASSHSPWFVVLGEDWAGHRRTQPLHEEIVSFYWHELFDQLLPWVSALSPTSVHLSDRRVDRILETALRSAEPGFANLSALIRTDNTTDSELWIDLLSRMGILPLDLPWNGRGARVSPDLIIMDLEERPRASGNSTTSRIDRWIEEWIDLKTRFPEAMRVAVDSFPRWDDWKQLVEIGVDVLLPKPFSTLGLQWSLHQWQQPASPRK
jgi:CheY-like chemotaxis protein